MSCYEHPNPMTPRTPGVIPLALKNGARVKANSVAAQGVYLPNNNIMTPDMRSPEFVQMSTAAAITLGIMGGKMYRCGCTRCLNLLLSLRLSLRTGLYSLGLWTHSTRLYSADCYTR